MEPSDIVELERGKLINNFHVDIAPNNHEISLSGGGLCEIIMTEQAVEELYAFLGKELEMHKVLKETKGLGSFINL